MHGEFAAVSSAHVLVRTSSCARLAGLPIPSRRGRAHLCARFILGARRSRI